MEQTAIDTPIRAYLTDYCRRTGRSLSGLARDAGYTPESLRAAMRAGRCSYRLSEALSEASGGELVPAVLAGLEAPPGAAA